MMNGINTYHRIEQIILSYFVNPVKFQTHAKRYRAEISGFAAKVTIRRDFFGKLVILRVADFSGFGI